MTSPRFPTRKLLAFAALGATDFALTWYLFRAGGGAVREANVVAAWWLARYGWLGLAGFKAATMALAAGSGVLVFLRRPATGHRVLGFACLALAAVVLYSGYLCDELRRHPAGLDPAEAVGLERAAEQIDARLGRSRDYHQTLVEAAADLRARRCSLAEAAARLATTEQARDPKWLAKFQLYYPGHGEGECLAISLLNYLERDADGSLCADLRAEYQSVYGRPPPSRFGATEVASAPATPPAPSVAQPVEQHPRLLAQRRVRHPHRRKVSPRGPDGGGQHPPRRDLGQHLGHVAEVA